MMDKAKAKAKQVKGKVKEKAGDATDNPRMKSEGTTDKMTGKVQETAAKAAERMKRDKR
ncbi:CsbD family protein [Streptomyces sp. NPDC003038]|uniref:CsbD family protein n=1 Tax=unclassified Streptomyces TaxID=2593676 RepID=UPI0033B04E19